MLGSPSLFEWDILKKRRLVALGHNNGDFQKMRKMIFKKMNNFFWAVKIFLKKQAKNLG